MSIKEIHTGVYLYGSTIYERGFRTDGTRFNRSAKPSPTLFIHSTEETGYQDIHGRPCMPKHFDTVTDAKDFLRNSAVPVLGQEDFTLQWISDNYGAGLEVSSKQINRCFLDIEVHAPEFPDPQAVKYPISCLTAYYSNTKRFKLYTQKEWNRSKSKLPDSVADRVDVFHGTEEQIIKELIKDFNTNEVDILSGWNSEGFDVPYILNRTDKLLGYNFTRKFSPFGLVKSREVKTKYGPRTAYTLGGINHLDYQQLYMKFTFDPRPNYKLDTIAKAEEVAGKLPFDGTLHSLWEADPNLYMDYNIQDVNVMLDLENNLNLIELAISLSYYAGIQMESVYSPIKTWDAVIYNSLKRTKKVLPPNKVGARSDFEGAFVIPTKAGFWRWILSFDLTSLYPSMIRMMNISPETIYNDFEAYPVIDWVNKKVPSAREQTDGDYTLVPCGRAYTKTKQGVIPEEIAKVFFQRKDYKKRSKEQEKLASSETDQIKKDEFLHMAKIFDVQQLNRKILINSLYGALGSPFFRFYDGMNALAVTSMGQLANRWMARKLNEWLSKKIGVEDDYIVAGDTDSVYVTFDQFVEKFVKPKVGDDKNKLTQAMNHIVEKAIQPYIDSFYEELYEYVNGMENTLAADREVIAPTAVFLAKKRYFLDVRDNEGTPYPEGKVKITGLETQRGSTPEWVRDNLKPLYRKILDEDKDGVYDFILKAESEYHNQDIYALASVSSANNIKKYTDVRGMPTKGCPGHIKAVAAYNRFLDANPDRTRLEKIGEGDKVCFLALKTPNGIEKGNGKLESFSWLSGDILPSDIHDMVDKYTDRNEMFEKTFLKPVHGVLDVVGWPREQTTDITSFF